MELNVPDIKAHVLVVDDDREMLVIMASLLERMGYLVSLASGLAPAIEVLKQKKIDVVLCDALLENELGCDLLKDADLNAPVVIMTGSLDPELRAEAFKLGAAGFLPKPFRIQELFDALGSALIHAEATR